MTDHKKKRMAMLDTLAAAAPAPVSMMSNNRALRAARDAVDAHHVWDLDPRQIEDTRIADRLDPSDFHDLQLAIEANGQTVPILVRRKPDDPDRYLLVYGRRRLEAIRRSDKVTTVRALVANMDDRSAVQAQISENMARRDLTFIEKALFAKELVDSGFGTQSQIAEVLTVTKSAVSMALSVLDSVGADLVRAIGPAQGVGRPRWEALGRRIEESGLSQSILCDVANKAFGQADRIALVDAPGPDAPDPSVAAFEAVAKAVERPAPPRRNAGKTDSTRQVRLEGRPIGAVRRSDNGLRIDIKDKAFAAWLDGKLDHVLHDLHDRWQTDAED